MRTASPIRQMALAAATTRDDKLAIMRDSHIGTYGVMALALGLMVKAACLASLTESAFAPSLALLAASGATLAGADRLADGFDATGPQ